MSQKTSFALEKTFKNYESIVKKKNKIYDKKEDMSKRKIDEVYNKLIYVLHFPKIKDNPFVLGVPGNDNVRKASARQARSLVALLEKRREINQHIRGIDACSSEIACRPCMKKYLGIIQEMDIIRQYVTIIRVVNCEEISRNYIDYLWMNLKRK